MSWSLLIPFAVSTFIACGLATEPLPDGTREVSAPPVYDLWWSMTEDCSSRAGEFTAIKWFIVPGVATFKHRDEQVSGYWSKADQGIVIAEKAMFDGGLVRHEMLHALIGQGGHSRNDFLERCGGTVVCLSGCIRDAGTAPVAGRSVARVEPVEMRIDIAVDPAQPQRSVNEGHFRLVVTVTNPRTDSVVVLLPWAGDAPPSSFNFLLNGQRTGLWFTQHAWDPGVTIYGPGATRRAVFDFVLADRFDGVRAMPEGTYQVRGGFGPATSPYRSFVFGAGQ